MRKRAAIPWIGIKHPSLPSKLFVPVGPSPPRTPPVPVVPVVVVELGVVLVLVEDAAALVQRHSDKDQALDAKINSLTYPCT